MVVAVRPRQVHWPLVALGAFAVVAVVVAFAAALDADPRVPTSYPAVYPLARFLDPIAGFGLVATGLAGLLVRGSTTSPIVILLGVQWLAADVAGWQEGSILVRSAAMLLLPLAVPLLAQLVLAQLNAVRAQPVGRRALAAAYLVFASTSAVHALTWDPTLDPSCWMQCAGNPFLVAPLPGMARALEVGWMAGSLAGGLVIVAIAAVAMRSRPARARGAPTLLPALLAALALSGSGLLGLVRPPEVPEDYLFAGAFALRALAWSTLAAGLAWSTWATWRRGRALERLAAELSDSPDPGSFQSALRRSIGDPEIEVAYWQPTYGRYVDVEGREVDPARTARAVSTIARNGAPVALVLHDPALSGTRKLEDEIGSAARVALDNERLRSEILAQLDDIRRARERIVNTGDAARRRLERDLHDGVQQHVLAAAYELQLAQAPAGEDASARGAVLPAALETARLVLREIRSLAQGIHPLILTEGGLAAALDTFAEETPIPLELDVRRGERYPEHIETTAYAVVTEAVDDAGSRGATYCSVEAGVVDGRLILRVEDDGEPNVWPPTLIADRIGALGGTIIQEPGGLTVELACE
ncbi:MAG: histidine kinase [Candidatus Limnocylindrales bacterium]